jgi:hypothetical protein
MVVFADADLEMASEQAVTFSLYNCGQVSGFGFRVSGFGFRVSGFAVGRWV